MEQLLLDIQQPLFNLVGLVLAACVSVVTAFATKWLKQKGIIAQLEAKKNIVSILVNAGEQIFTELKGQEKFEAVKKNIVRELNAKKIKFTNEELEHLIESVVKEMNQAYKDIVGK